MNTRITAFALIALILAGTVAWALAPAPVTAAGPHDLVNVSTGLTSTGAPLALHGYDPVAYFTDGAPRLGTAKFSAKHAGATYRFASEAHLDAFDDAPERYVPSFGGFCAYGVSVGKKFDGDPNQWAVVDGMLYLNLNADIRAVWKEDVPGNIRKAVEEWSDIKGKATASL